MQNDSKRLAINSETEHFLPKNKDFAAKKKRKKAKTGKRDEFNSIFRSVVLIKLSISTTNLIRGTNRKIRKPGMGFSY
jgi:hypothetical protein